MPYDMKLSAAQTDTLDNWDSDGDNLYYQLTCKADDLADSLGDTVRVISSDGYIVYETHPDVMTRH